MRRNLVKTRLSWGAGWRVGHLGMEWFRICSGLSKSTPIQSTLTCKGKVAWDICASLQVVQVMESYSDKGGAVGDLDGDGVVEEARCKLDIFGDMHPAQDCPRAQAQPGVDDGILYDGV